MESGRFAVLLVIVVILIGELGYYGNQQVVDLGRRIDAVQSKAENAETLATEAQNAAKDAKTVAADAVAAAPMPALTSRSWSN